MDCIFRLSHSQPFEHLLLDFRLARKLELQYKTDLVSEPIHFYCNILKTS